MEIISVGCSKLLSKLNLLARIVTLLTYYRKMFIIKHMVSC